MNQHLNSADTIHYTLIHSPTRCQTRFRGSGPDMFADKTNLPYNENFKNISILLFESLTF